MSVPRKLIKSFKTQKKLKPNTTNTLNLETPLSLIRHMGPQIQELFAAPWFQTAKEYFTNPPVIHILSIDTKEILLLDILGELRNYLTDPDIVFHVLQENHISSNNDRYLAKIRAILNKIDTKHITRIQRRALRKYIEINPLGRVILKGFYEKIVADGKIAPEMELIFNPYTSLVNLAEIYAQCSEHSLVKYSVPELGIQEARINLYYPAKKRDEYLAQELGADTLLNNRQLAWLPDALRRICFFNKLLGTKKQPRAIHIFLANFSKEFMHVSGKEDIVFTPSEINTGVCNMIDIIITRSEESLKTLLHELIHFHELDFKHPTHDEFCAGLFNITTEQSSFNLFEAHTECLASILHCLTRAVMPLTQSQYQIDKEIRRLLIKQIYYTMKKVAQILATSGCDSYVEFITPTDKDKCQLRENTNVFSYFFVKSFIYLGLQDWLLGCCDQKTARFLVDTDNTNSPLSSQEMLKKIIQDGYQNKILTKIINNHINLAHQQSQLDHRRSVKKSVSIVDNSLKMVCVA